MNPDTLCFLDIDGVLNRTSWFKKAKRLNLGRDHLDPVLCRRLQRVLAPVDAAVVISSTWRHLWHMNELVDMLGDKGLTAPIIGRTPVIHLDDAELHRTAGRGMEIQWFLRTYHPEPETLKIAILDDNSDMGQLRSRLVQPDTFKGLTYADARSLKEMLATSLGPMEWAPDALQYEVGTRAVPCCIADWSLI